MTALERNLPATFPDIMTNLQVSCHLLSKFVCRVWKHFLLRFPMEGQQEMDVPQGQKHLGSWSMLPGQHPMRSQLLI